MDEITFYTVPSHNSTTVGLTDFDKILPQRFLLVHPACFMLFAREHQKLAFTN
jgi:hypothetical protein